MWRSFFLLLLCWAASGGGAPLAILHEGRVQPLDSYARRVLLLWNGRDSFAGYSAESLLIALAEQPERAGGWPLFRIDRSDVGEALGLASGKRYFSYLDLQKSRYKLDVYAKRAMATEGQRLHPMEREMLRLHKGVLVFEQWQRVLQPLRPTLPGSKWQGQSYWNALPPDPICIWPDHRGGWKSLGQILHNALADSLLKGLEQVKPAAYFSSVRAWQEGLEPDVQRRLRVEYVYNKIKPFGYAPWILVAVVMVGAASLARNWKGFRYLEAVGLAVVLLLAVAGIGARCYIGQRPPVTNLYESLLLVGTLGVAIGCFLRMHWRGGGLLGAVAGLLVFSLASLYAGTDDSLGVLAAVLHSNFWLTAHVATIALGYAGILCAGLVGHWWLVLRIRNASSAALARVRSFLYGTLAWGLLFTFIGTVLGGIWADQAWGRFWGWDPKENGALLLILWIAILFHARRTGWLRDRGIALGAVLGLVLLVLAWFGVNMLGVGLHAYGAHAQGGWLAIYVAVQLLVAGGLAWFSRPDAN